MDIQRGEHGDERNPVPGGGLAEGIEEAEHEVGDERLVLLFIDAHAHFNLAARGSVLAGDAQALEHAAYPGAGSREDVGAREHGP